ncbi:uncharacterized protein KY384_002618 [Bacidia gigantensis]|uniref:uncharacterized protein n=1 Tax=Bacidia gigantensis TaxID=2732470 RepID=UPI001D05A32C|nr:uncharacterized protein KY384_002618 [Bacidia gigantensis]KAG8532741.1 hypothetical protein KY384_002618 [Bacidia gigantensis]
MPSHTNPNKPSKVKRQHKAAAKAKSRQRHGQRISKTLTPAPITKKKARKLDKKSGYAKQRALAQQLQESEVEMKDVGSAQKKSETQKGLADEDGGTVMDIAT